MEDKIRGMIFGGAMGDALGLPHEFRKRKYTGLFLTTSNYNKWNRKTRTTEAGQFSDDTEMAICIFNHVFENNLKYQREKCVLEYMRWANGDKKRGEANCTFMGRNTRALFGGVKTYKGYVKHYQERFSNEKVMEDAQSNGCLMRCYPFAIFKCLLGDKVDEWIKDDCYATNPSSVSLDCVKAYISCLVLALQSASLSQIKQILKPYSVIETKERSSQKSSIVDGVLEDKKTDSNAIVDNQPVCYQHITEGECDIKTNKGWIKNAMYCVYLAVECGSYQEAMDKIIKLGGDTDTNACIAGSLLGAIYGLSGILQDEKTKQNYETFINRQELGDYVRPKRYSKSRLLEIADDVVKLF